ncbi:DNA-binding protein WhiA [Mycoplasma marinum]|uniref:Probable cell division protein WhiA n=1 Tax=Mycoplasma marinum TaxID=1937190 RepID=A0A4R0XLQ0_9MOLU|nr:DNA-binding protein WhiA [Mycoplasma marinum]TCG11626.1 DNA-binding protein WhiA [Mycoplasma marinum]
MSFSFEIKNEILFQEMNREQANALVHGIVASSGYLDENVILKLNNSDISNLIRDLFIQLKIEHSTDKENKNWIALDSKDVEREYEIKQPGFYFAGVFIGGGSISDPSSTSYHLEMQFYYRNQAEKVKNFLDNYQFNFSLIQRRKNWVLYIKKSELIADFLRAIRTPISLMKFEDARIERDFRNNLNRYSNLDIYNQEKLSKASTMHLKNYEYVIKNNLLDSFREDEIKFFELKKKNPYSSLSELVILLEKKGVKKTRAGLNHWLIKLRKVAED